MTEVTVRHRFFSDEEYKKPKVMRGEKKEKESKRIKPLAAIGSANTKQTHLQPHENESSH